MEDEYVGEGFLTKFEAVHIFPQAVIERLVSEEVLEESSEKRGCIVEGYRILNKQMFDRHLNSQ